MSRIHFRTAALCLGLALVTLAAYSNHFGNAFHFDDFHTITGNIFVRDLHNVPRFFTGAALSSANPDAATYRPVTSATLALDYWLGGGFDPFWFHLSTFLWFEVQLILMFLLFRRLMDLADPQPSNLWTALLAAALYGLHPANAETVNYIIQRGDLYNTLGVVASLLWFMAYPGQRKRGWYLLPAVLAYLAKAPALIYPLILLAYVFLFELDGDRRKWGAALRATLPALMVTAAAAVLSVVMTPSTYSPGAVSPWLYRLTQPWVALHYFQSFFLPTGLSADTDWTYVSPYGIRALAGYLFVAALVTAIVYSARRRETRPVAFGLVWFLLALLPTSAMPLAEVTNDHRMFFPFVGLALAVCWAARLALLRTQRIPERALLAGIAVVLIAAALGTRERNRVWSTEETLWQDVTLKSPKNGRGLMNYGALFVARGEYGKALDYLERARALKPDYPLIELNLGVTYGTMGRQEEAEKHFRRSLALADWGDLHYFYGSWLRSWGRAAEAQQQLETAVHANRYSFPARSLLMQIYSDQGNLKALDALFQETIRLAYDEEAVRRFQEARESFEKNRQSWQQGGGASPATLARQAAEACKAGKYADCLSDAQKAIELRPDYAEAYNNMAFALIAMKRLDDGIRALQEAVRIKPDYTVARNNLARALEQKRLEQSAPPPDR